MRRQFRPQLLFNELQPARRCGFCNNYFSAEEWAMKHNCPICGAAVNSETHEEFPFCSDRCREIDLGNWATERYVISEPAFDEEALEKLMLEEPDEENENGPSDSDDSDSRK
jgi:endogenous inhibitor of DNA gyrase (YacG/DUF329 family)